MSFYNTLKKAKPIFLNDKNLIFVMCQLQQQQQQHIEFSSWIEVVEVESVLNFEFWRFIF